MKKRFYVQIDLDIPKMALGCPLKKDNEICDILQKNITDFINDDFFSNCFSVKVQVSTDKESINGANKS